MTTASQNAEGGGIFSYRDPCRSSTARSRATAVGQGGDQVLGGGIYIDGRALEPPTRKHVLQARPSNGTVAAGGAIYATDSNVSITGGSISSNSVYGSVVVVAPNSSGGNQAEGGGIYFAAGAGGNSLTISNSQIDQNQAFGGTEGNAAGGGIDFQGVAGGPNTSALTVTSSTVSGNIGQAGNGINGADRAAGSDGNSAPILAPDYISASPWCAGAALGGAGGAVFGGGLSLTDGVLSLTNTVIGSNGAAGGAGGNGGGGGAGGTGGTQTNTPLAGARMVPAAEPAATEVLPRVEGSVDRHRQSDVDRRHLRVQHLLRRLRRCRRRPAVPAARAASASGHANRATGRRRRLRGRRGNGGSEPGCRHRRQWFCRPDHGDERPRQRLGRRYRWPGGGRGANGGNGQVGPRRSIIVYALSNIPGGASAVGLTTQATTGSAGGIGGFAGSGGGAAPPSSSRPAPSSWTARPSWTTPSPAATATWAATAAMAAMRQAAAAAAARRRRRRWVRRSRHGGGLELSVTTNASLTNSTLDGNAVVGGVAGGPGVGGVAGQGGGSTISRLLFLPLLEPRRGDLGRRVPRGRISSRRWSATFASLCGRRAVPSTSVGPNIVSDRPTAPAVRPRRARPATAWPRGAACISTPEISPCSTTPSPRTAPTRAAGAVHELPRRRTLPSSTSSSTVIAQNKSGLLRLRPGHRGFRQNTDVDDLGRDFDRGRERDGRAHCRRRRQRRPAPGTMEAPLNPQLGAKSGRPARPCRIGYAAAGRARWPNPANPCSGRQSRPDGRRNAGGQRICPRQPSRSGPSTSPRPY